MRHIPHEIITTEPPPAYLSSPCRKHRPRYPSSYSQYHLHAYRPPMSHLDEQRFEELKRRYPYEGVDSDPLAYRHSPYYPKVVDFDVDLDELQRIADENFRQAEHPQRATMVAKFRRLYNFLASWSCARSSH